MSEKITIEEAVGRTFLGHCLMEALAKIKDKTVIEKIGLVSGKNKELDVSLTINGVEVKFSEFMNTLQEQHERMLEEKAQEMMKDRFAGFSETLGEMEHKVKEMFYQSFPNAREDVW